jgi:hypothetical protein
MRVNKRWVAQSRIIPIADIARLAAGGLGGTIGLVRYQW